MMTLYMSCVCAYIHTFIYIYTEREIMNMYVYSLLSSIKKLRTNLETYCFPCSTYFSSITLVV